ncbi:MAG: multidrug DMT transporter permease, partial [Donghicola eburneus]|nr:multidrug DMT transporter permease [Donghicola eburneus]
VDAYGVKTLGIAPVVLEWFSNLLRFFLLLPLVLVNPRRAIESMRGYWWTALGVGLLSPLSYILVLAALTGGAVGPWRLVGCGVLIAGAVLLSAS